MRLVATSPHPRLVHLVPRLRTQDKVHILDALVPPDGRVHALPAHRLERIVHVRQGDPAPGVQVRQQVLVREGVPLAMGVHALQDLGEEHARGVHDEQAAVEGSEGEGRVAALGLREGRVRVLGREGAVGGDPCGRVVRPAEGVAHAGVGGGEEPLAGDVAGAGAGAGAGAVLCRRIKLQVHQLIHVAQDHHVRVEADDARKLRELEHDELGPAVVETGVLVVAFAGPGTEERDRQGGDPAGREGRERGRGERGGVEGQEGVLGVDGAEGVGEGEEAGEVGCVGDEGDPD